MKSAKSAAVWLCWVLATPVLASEASPAAPEEVQRSDREVEAAPESTSTSVYRSVDDKGNPVFTDTPPEGAPAEEVRVRSPNTMSAPLPPAAQGPEGLPSAAATPAYTVAINSPKDQDTFQNPEKPIEVGVTVSPNLGDGYRIQLTDNGVAINNYKVDHLIRGTHALKASIIDEDGEVVAESSTVTVYVHRPSVRKAP